MDKLMVDDQGQIYKTSSRSELTAEIGAGGVSFYSGLIDNDEFNKDLSGSTAIETYDKMRRSDAQVAAFFGTAQASDFTVGDGTVTYTGPDEWSLNRFILHYAALCAAAGAHLLALRSDAPAPGLELTPLPEEEVVDLLRAIKEGWDGIREEAVGGQQQAV